jgi:predicted deacylase
VLECENLDEAIEWANKVPLQSGAIEIRAVMDLSQYGSESKTLPREGDCVAAVATPASARH